MSDTPKKIWCLFEGSDEGQYLLPPPFSTKMLADAYLKTFPEWDRELNQIAVTEVEMDSPLIPWGTRGFLVKRKEAYAGEAHIPLTEPLWDVQPTRPEPKMKNDKPQYEPIRAANHTHHWIVYVSCYAENPKKAIEKVDAWRAAALYAGTYPSRERPDYKPRPADADSRNT